MIRNFYKTSGLLNKSNHSHVHIPSKLYNRCLWAANKLSYNQTPGVWCQVGTRISRMSLIGPQCNNLLSVCVTGGKIYWLSELHSQRGVCIHSIGLHTQYRGMHTHHTMYSLLSFRSMGTASNNILQLFYIKTKLITVMIDFLSSVISLAGWCKASTEVSQLTC